MSTLALAEIDGALATVTLNRPHARNPTSIAMLDALDEALDLVVAAETVTVMVLRGAGKSFCSGLDLEEVRGPEATIRTLLTRLSEVMRRLRRLPCVTIARVQGAAIGGGFGFMAVSDFTVTHPEARIGYPPLETGLSPALMSPWLIRLVGPARARSMLLSGGTISGSAAHEIGIASHLAPLDGLDSTIRELVERLRSGPPHAQRAMKRLLNEIDGSEDDRALDRAARVSADVIASSETQARLGNLGGGR